MWRDELRALKCDGPGSNPNFFSLSLCGHRQSLLCLNFSVSKMGTIKTFTS